MLSLAVRFAAKELASRLDAFTLRYMHATNGAGQHTLRLIFIPETIAPERRPFSRAAVRARTQAGEHTEKDPRERPDSNDENDDEQENDQNQFDEHASSLKRPLFIVSAV